MAGETYLEYNVISKKGIDIAKIDYYLQRDTTQEKGIIREFYPDRLITSSFSDVLENNDRITRYSLTIDEVKKIKTNPDVLDVEVNIPHEVLLDPSSSIFLTTGSILSRRYSANYSNYDYMAEHSLYNTNSANLNWGLHFHTAYTESVDWEEMFGYDSISNTIITGSIDFKYTLDGTGVDLVILDSGVKPHPEFLDENGNSRLKQIDWFQYLRNEQGEGPNLPSNFYTALDYSAHGTFVASIAAGKYNGWAKNVDIYSFRVFGGDLGGEGSLEQAFTCIKKFHEQKPIDPNTGFKRPTIVNASLGEYANILGRFSRFYLEPPTHITQVYYKGISQNLTGNDNHVGNQYNIRYSISGSDFSLIEFNCYVPLYSNYNNTLIEQMTDAGVIFIKAAGNNNAIITREGDEYYNDLYETYITRDRSTELIPAGSPVYTNRSDLCSPDSIIVGAISTFPVIKGPLMDDPTHSSYLSYTYDIWGYYGNLLEVDPLWHNDPSWWVEAPYPFKTRKSIGNYNTFIGWENLRQSASLCLSYFSTVGQGVDIFAAGDYIIGANFTTSSGIPVEEPRGSFFRDYLLYDPNYNPNNYAPTTPPLENTNYMAVASGTSFAAPQVAGVACLYFQLNPGATAQQFKQFLSASAIKTPQMSIFDEDPLTRYDYTGSVPLTSGSYMIAKNSLSLQGAPNRVLHWPYGNPNPAKIS